MKKTSNKKKHFASIVVSLSILSILLYTIGVFVCIIISSQSPPAELTTAFFAFFGGELLALAGIKINKTKSSISSNVDESI